MVNKYYRKIKKKLEKEASERYQNLSEEEEEEKGKQRPWTDIKIFLKGKKRKRISIIVTEVRIFQKRKNKSNLNI